jgi:glycine betaine/proline transport system ATP-binding protein
VIRDAVRPILGADRPIRVVSGGALLGLVGAAEILAVIAEEPAAAEPDAAASAAGEG